MAPFCADPREIVIALEPQRRIELLELVDDIILSMGAHLQARPEELGSLSMDSSIHQDNDTPQSEKIPGTPSSTDDAVKTERWSETVTLFDADEVEAGLVNAANENGKKKSSSPNPFKNVKIGVPWKNKPGSPSKKTRRAEEVQSAARQHMEEWKREFLPKLEEIIHVADTERIVTERKARRQAVEMNEENERAERKRNADSDEARDEEAAFAVLQRLYPPLPTPLTELSVHDRREAMSCVLLLLLATGKYSAHSRALMLRLASSLDIPHSLLNEEEAEIAQSLIEQSTADKGLKESMSAEAEAAKRQQDNRRGRFWKVGLASVAGATIIGITGGLAAPLVAGTMASILGGLGLGGVASFLGVFWMNGALVGALFGAYGAKMTGSMMDKYAREVQDFKFIPLHEPNTTAANPAQQNAQYRRLRVTIGINGWLNSEDDITRPWAALPPDSEVFALRYEMKALLALGAALRGLVRSIAWKTLKVEIIKRTVLATLWAALWPIQVLAIASNVDNPFHHASNRSKKAGRLLADALASRVQGERPVTLIGYSLGAAAVHACLQALAERRAFGLVDTVVLVGAPAPADPAHWRSLRAVVSGAVFNVYSANDMVLGYVYRAHSPSLVGGGGIAGLQAIEGAGVGVQNLDLSDRVSGHLRYPELVGAILRECGFAGVRVPREIEKDEVIRLKDEYAAGHAVDVDGTAVVPGDAQGAGDEGETGLETATARTAQLHIHGRSSKLDKEEEEQEEEQEDVPPPPPMPPRQQPVQTLTEAEKPRMYRKPVAARNEDDLKPITMIDNE